MPSAALQFLMACGGTCSPLAPVVVKFTLWVNDTLQNVVRLLPAATFEATMTREAQPSSVPFM